MTHQVSPLTIDGPKKKRFERVASMTFLALTVIATVIIDDPIRGIMPIQGLDPSWRFAVAEAIDKHLAFGKDIIFTFGPLAPVYTGFFLPDQQGMVFVVKGIIVGGVSLGLIGLLARRNQWIAISLPLIISLIYIPDAFFLASPLILVLLVQKGRQGWRGSMPLFSFLASINTCFVLVKGSFLPIVSFSVALSTLYAFKKFHFRSFLIPLASLATLLSMWGVTGQSFLSLPAYIDSIFYVAAGYTEAMSLPGNSIDIITYCLGSAIFLMILRYYRIIPIKVIGFIVIILFIAFKAGFVRHDSHAIIAAQTLLFVGFILLVSSVNLRTSAGFSICCAAWFIIMLNYSSAPFAQPITTILSILSMNTYSIKETIAEPQAFQRDFEKARLEVAAITKLPQLSGSVDIFPYEQSVLLASGQKYSMRPVMQSYYAYTGKMAEINAEWLNSKDAPDHILFDIKPIDGRFPTLEDGPSWPVLLGRYRFQSYIGNYALLDLIENSKPAEIAPLIKSGHYQMGEKIDVPKSADVVWTHVEFHSSLLGRFVSTIFKLPILRIAVTLESGLSEDYRLVPNMSGAGFLLSPAVKYSNEFVALHSDDPSVLAGQKVVSFKIYSNDPLSLWKSDLDIDFSSLLVPRDPAVDREIFAKITTGAPVADLPRIDTCVIDTIDGVSPSHGPVSVKGRSIVVNGWAVPSSTKDEPDARLSLALIPGHGATEYADANAHRFARPDVDAHLRLPYIANAGFTTRIALSGTKGSTTLQLVEDTLNGRLNCGQPATIVTD